MHPRPSSIAADPVVLRPHGRHGFTIVELLVVAVIMAILSSLMLAGLGRVRHRAKVDKTKSTIRKLHEIVMPQYESYLRRRVPFATSTNARQNAVNRLVAIRTLALYEMPDSWIDVGTGTSPVLTWSGTMEGLVAGSVISGTIPDFAFTASARAYAAVRQALSGSLTHQHRSSECLFMICSRGQSEPDVMEHFRSDEIGDTDNDGAPEFLDGWGRPISFMRWPTGFVAPLSPVQVDDPVNRHDPFDPQRAEVAAFALVPLVYSAGSDGVDGIVQLNSWTTNPRATLFSVTDGATPPLKPGAPLSTAANTFRDNITNHDFSVR